MRVHVDAWDPAYGSGLVPGDSTESTAELDTGVEVPATDWRAFGPPADVAPPSTVLLVDGVRRLDARLWVVDDEETVHMGLAASYAAGVVRCDLRRGAAEVAGARVERGLFSAATAPAEMAAGTVRYRLWTVKRGEPTDLELGVQRRLQNLEVAVATGAREQSTVDDDLLVVDGPLRGRAHLPRSLGYVKTHRVEYLPRALSTVVGRMAAGERCPVFLLGTNWHRYTWYLRLPGPPGSPWSGVVRVECSAELSRQAAVALADLSTVTLPRFASAPYKDPRAPQNLVPVAGLERRLRGMLGDARLLHRALTQAAHRVTAQREDRSLRGPQSQANDTAAAR
jgi:hypothetical protein